MKLTIIHFGRTFLRLVAAHERSNVVIVVGRVVVVPRHDVHAAGESFEGSEWLLFFGHQK